MHKFWWKISITVWSSWSKEHHIPYDLTILPICCPHYTLATITLSVLDVSVKFYILFVFVLVVYWWCGIGALDVNLRYRQTLPVSSQCFVQYMLVILCWCSLLRFCKFLLVKTKLNPSHSAQCTHILSCGKVPLRWDSTKSNLAIVCLPVKCFSMNHDIDALRAAFFRSAIPFLHGILPYLILYHMLIAFALTNMIFSNRSLWKFLHVKVLLCATHLKKSSQKIVSLILHEFICCSVYFIKWAVSLLPFT